MGKTLLVENAGHLTPLYLVYVSFYSRFSVVYFVFQAKRLTLRWTGSWASSSEKQVPPLPLPLLLLLLPPPLLLLLLLPLLLLLLLPLLLLLLLLPPPPLLLINTCIRRQFLCSSW